MIHIGILQALGLFLVPLLVGGALGVMFYKKILAQGKRTEDQAKAIGETGQKVVDQIKQAAEKIVK